MFQDFTYKDIESLANHNLTYNSHSFAISPERFLEDKGLRDFWHVTSVSEIPNNGTRFVASIEAKKYPFLAT